MSESIGKIGCGCGGTIEFIVLDDEAALAHTMPSCSGFDALDANELIKVSGALGIAVAKLSIKAKS